MRAPAVRESTPSLRSGIVNCLLRIRWASSTPENVTAAVANDLSPSIGAASLDRAVILLNNVIEITARTHAHGLPAGILIAGQPQTAVGSGVSIEMDLLRPSRPCYFDRLSKELLKLSWTHSWHS